VCERKEIGRKRRVDETSEWLRVVRNLVCRREEKSGGEKG
jgi:hypothetical protein